MRVVVFLAAVLDPKWTLSFSESGGLPARDPQKLSLSPFDEAALELALRLREGKGGGCCSLHVCLLGQESERLARKVAAYKPDTIKTVSLPPEGLAERRNLSAALAECAGRQDGPADVVLIGREFGDCDDGAVPAMLARLMGVGYVGLIHAIELDGPDVRFQRRRDGTLESILCAPPMLASVERQGQPAAPSPNEECHAGPQCGNRPP